MGGLLLFALIYFEIGKFVFATVIENTSSGILNHVKRLCFKRFPATCFKRSSILGRVGLVLGVAILRSHVVL